MTITIVSRIMQYQSAVLATSHYRKIAFSVKFVFTFAKTRCPKLTLQKCHKLRRLLDHLSLLSQDYKLHHDEALLLIKTVLF